MKTPAVIAIVLLASLSGAARGGGNGAVRVDFDPNVGFAILNTAASGKLIANAHLEDALPNEEFSVSLRVRYEDDSVEVFEDIAMLTTNGQGKGNVQVQVDINPPAGSETLRRVAVRVRRAPNPLYVAIGWDLPLK